MTKDAHFQQFIALPPRTVFCGRCLIEVELPMGQESTICPKCRQKVSE